MTDASAELTLALTTELRTLSSNVFEGNIDIRSSDKWLVGTILELGVVTGLKWADLVEGFSEIASLSPLIHGFWTDDSAIWLHMGLNVWKSTRLDRFAGSRVLSMANNEAMNSIKRMQTVKLVLIDDDYPALSSDTSIDLNGYQTMVHYLRASLRLGAADTSRVVRLLAEQGVE